MNKVVLKSVIIARDGERISPPIGKAFAFTKEEVEEIEAANPTAIRDAKNEDDEASLAEVKALSQTNTRIRPRNVPAGAGKTSAMVDGMDGTGATGEGGSDAAAQTIEEIEAGLADLDNDALTAALNAERAGKNRKGAVSLYEAEIAKRQPPADDDL